MRWELPRRLDSLPALFVATREFLSSLSVPYSDDESLRRSLDLALEELFVTLLQHAHGGADTVLLEMEVGRGEITASLTDRDVDAFDQADVPVPNLEASLSERQPGGLGLLLAAAMTDNLQWDYSDGNVTVTVIKRLRENDV